MTLSVGARIGAYEVVEPLGSGGMGEVYRARDSKLNREVALKILPEASATDPERLVRFKREAQVLASLNHYLEAGAFTQADSEFDRCIKRRGEALALFLDEEPTYRYFPPVYYYQGLVREGLRAEGFAESYRIYLSIRGTSTEDALVAEIRQRMQQ
jgi:serine/threonine protein kinase